MLSKFIIVVDHRYFAGEDELVNNPDKFNSPWSNNSFHAQRVSTTGLAFVEEIQNAKIIEGRNCLISWVKRVLDYFTTNEEMPSTIKIIKMQGGVFVDETQEVVK